MARFLQRYVRPPLSEMVKHDDDALENIQLSWTAKSIEIRSPAGIVTIPRIG